MIFKVLLEKVEECQSGLQPPDEVADLDEVQALEAVVDGFPQPGWPDPTTAVTKMNGGLDSSAKAKLRKKAVVLGKFSVPRSAEVHKHAPA